MVNVKAKRDDVPIIAFERWTQVSDDNGTSLMKKFVFVDLCDRAEFVKTLMKYECKTQHAAKMLVMEKSVALALQTANVNAITDVDKEYARFADETYKDITVRTTSWER